MPDQDVQFLGMIRTDNISEIDSAVALSVEATIDPDFVRDFARAHEAAGFDRVLIGYHSTGPDAWLVAAHAAAHTERLHMLVAHRPGFQAPTVAARAAVTLDHFSGGRVSLNIVTGGSDSELARDGDWSAKDDRYRRTDEFLDVVRAMWTSAEPFDYEGEFYRVKNAFSDVKPLQTPLDPDLLRRRLRSGRAGRREARRRLHVLGRAARGHHGADGCRAGCHASRALPGLQRLRATHPWRHGSRSVGQGARLPGADRRPSRASRPAPPPRPARNGCSISPRNARSSTTGSGWPIAAATGAGGNTSALVGTPEQVAQSLLRYYDAGVTSFLIRGFEPLQDAAEFGRELIPLVREGVARRGRANRVAV